MSKRKANDPQSGDNVVDYRHKNVTRLNIPPAGLAAHGQIAKEKQIKFAYNPHLAPVLRFDATGMSCPPKTIPVIISQKGGINGQKGIYTGTDHQQAPRGGNSLKPGRNR
jgi:hypothetical protein